MAVFEFQGANGEIFEIEAPDENAAISAFRNIPAADLEKMQTPPAGDTAPDQRRGSLLSPLVQGLTFGFGDEIAGATRAAGRVAKGFVTGEREGFGDAYGEEVARSRQMLAEAREDSPWASAGAEIGGSILPILATGGLGLAARGASAGGRLAAGAAEGAAAGAAYGFGTGEGGASERASGAALGGGVGLLAGAGGAAVANRFAARAGSRTVPTRAEVADQARAAYGRAESAGTIFSGREMTALRSDVISDLTKLAYHPQNQKNIQPILRELNRLRGGNVTYQGLQALRQMTTDGMEGATAKGKTMANSIKDRIDQMISATASGEGHVLGNTLTGRVKRDTVLDSALTRAGRRAASTGTGSNFDNATRQNVRQLLDTPRTARGMSPAEVAAAENVATGGGRYSGRNLARWAGRMAPTGIVSLGANAGIGGLVGSALGPGAGFATTGAMMGVGAASRFAANRSTQKAAGRMSEIIRSGGQTGADLARAARAGAPVRPELAQTIARQSAIERRAVPFLGAASESGRQDILQVDVRPKRYR